MAYSFPPNDDRPSSYISPTSSNRSYFSDQAVRSGYPMTADSREAEFQRYPNDLRDPVGREREKEMIRAEILAEQMERRRILEEEVRRELMLEREVSMRRWESSRMLFDAPSETRPFVHEPPIMPQSFGHYEDPRRFPSLTMVSMPMPSRPVAEVGILRSSPFQQYPIRSASSSLGLPVIRHLPESRRETILLAKREPNITGVNRKRKASALEDDHRYRARTFENKPKAWSCDLCKITTTNEINLKQHFRGKKHKLMVEGVPPEEIHVLKELPLKTDKPEPSHTIVKKASTKSEKLSASSPNEATDADQIKKIKPNGSLKIREPGSSTTRGGSTEKREARSSTRPGGPFKKREQGSSTTPSAKKFKFWCKMCQVGATSEVVLTAHEKGKKHLARLEELKAAPGSSSSKPEGP